MVSFQSIEEKIIFYSISLTWVFYLFGALYVLAPAVGWLLISLLALRWIAEEKGSEYYPPLPPVTITVWIIAMIVMQVALVMGHLNYDLGVGKLIKSSIGWMKGWALLAVFPVIGACMKIRPEILYRACALVYMQTLILVPIFVAAYILHLPSTLFVSPLKAIGGPGPEFFEVQLYSFEAGAGTVRWRFFSPWAPAAAFAAGVACAMLVREKNLLIKAAAIGGILAVALMCKSRLGVVAIPISLVTAFFLARLYNPKILFLGAVGVFLVGLLLEPIIELLMMQKEKMESARADSTYVRAALARIAVHRWWTEAPIWGHGILERGPHMVEFMPIGSHHSWFGLLFVKGLVGFFALAIPMAVTFVELLAKSQANRSAEVGLAIFMLMFFFTFTENLEILTYLIWPGLIMLGIAAREPLRIPKIEEKMTLMGKKY